MADDTQKWARDYFDLVDQARVAKERADAIYNAKRAKAFALPAHVEKNTIDMVDAEDDRNRAYAWADDVLNEWDDMMNGVRPELTGIVGLGLDIANARYREGLSIKAIRNLFHISHTHYYRALDATVDYLDYLGPSRGLSPDADPRQAVPPDFVPLRDDWADDYEDDTYFMDYVPDSVDEAVAYLRQLSQNETEE